MKMMPGCPLWDEIGREKTEELCCLHALGELSPEENVRLEEHLRHCRQCNALAREYQRLMLFDLSAAAVVRSEDSLPEEPANVREGELLANIRQRANRALGWRAARLQQPEGVDAEGGNRGWQRAVRVAWPLMTYAFCAMAAMFLLAYVLTRPSRQPLDSAVRQGAFQQPASAGPDAELQARLRTTEASMRELQKQLGQALRSDRNAQIGYGRLSGEYRDLNGRYAALEEQLTREQAAVEEKDAELSLSRQTLTEQRMAKESLQGQLSEIYDRLEKQNAEVVRLERVASTVPASFPVTEHVVSDTEAKEILGARDLHIVDVYDVDDFGKSSRAYGRIYYVNRSQLVFYAFDLSKLESNHKVVAFQVWGFRQPQSSKVESLGLFYMDNATLNRWTLRVSDPRILSRIDTLFVTVEPPGGSRFPKGRRLLMASLAGPPNHP